MELIEKAVKILKKRGLFTLHEIQGKKKGLLLNNGMLMNHTGPWFSPMWNSALKICGLVPCANTKFL